MNLETQHEQIRQFYDRSTRLWMDTWGEHMHHGFYCQNGSVKKSRQQPQIDMIAELLKWGRVERASSILDAGCGVGGSARFLANRFNAKVLGLTLSPVQAAEGLRLNQLAGLVDLVKIEVGDYMELGGEGEKFDLIWSLESAEYIADKQKMLEIFYRLLKPGGKLLLATWCRRETPPELKPKEKNVLEKIYRLYFLPPMISIQELAKHAQSVGFQEVKAADWSSSVAPFWDEVRKSALTWRSLSGLLRSGWTTMQGAWAVQYMTQAYRFGALKFGVLQAQKP
ncbi:MAG: class I SAM-dependent methyltransferase [Bacteroidota bacterium]